MIPTGGEGAGQGRTGARSAGMSSNLSLAPSPYTWVMDPLPFEEGSREVIAAFTLHGQAAGHTERTLTARAATIRRLAVSVDVRTATGEELIEWLAGLPLARSSRATYRAHLRAFFTWLHESGRREDNPALKVPAARVPRNLPRPVSPTDVQAILTACSDPRAAMTRAYVLLAAYAGLRVHEIAKLRGEDMQAGEVVVRGKGEGISTVPMHPLLTMLAETMPTSGWWFPSSSSTGHVSRVTVSQAISRAMRRAGVSGTPHALRHHFGTQVLRSSGGDLRTAQRLLRHASPATTAIYTQVLDETAFRAVAGIPAA